MKGISTTLVLCCLGLGLVACGNGGSTTIEEPSTASSAESARVEALRLEKEKAEFEAQTAKAEARSEARSAARAQVAAEQEPAPEPEPEEVPDVIGMRLPQARSTLSAAGYMTRAENTDTTFGIVIPSHYTVCEQSDPQGNLVTVLAQKYGC